MSFERFTAAWPAALEPWREWSLMETPYKKKKINPAHYSSNFVEEKTGFWIRNVKDNTLESEGGLGVAGHTF